MTHSVWDWDLMHDPEAACVSKQPVHSDPVDSHSQSGSGVGGVGGQSVAASGILSPPSKRNLLDFVLNYLQSAADLLHDQSDLQLLAGVLDVCLHLFKSGELHDLPKVEASY